MHRTSTTALHRLLGDQTWQEDAACKPNDEYPVDPEWFFPDPDETEKIAKAKALCTRCPVRRTCLDAALETGDTNGIRGGLTEEERSPLHDRIHTRVDWTRVSEAVAGRDIHLTKTERRAVVLAAYRQGLSEERLAWILKISLGHAQKLYRAIRRAQRNRDLRQRQPRQGDARDFGTAA